MVIDASMLQLGPLVNMRALQAIFGPGRPEVTLARASARAPGLPGGAGQSKSGGPSAVFALTLGEKT
jgi:hypothetical protein